MLERGNSESPSTTLEITLSALFSVVYTISKTIYCDYTGSFGNPLLKILEFDT
jgi:hypothetical protein